MAQVFLDEKGRQHVTPYCELVNTALIEWVLWPDNWPRDRFCDDCWPQMEKGALMPKLLHSEEHLSLIRYSGESKAGGFPTMIQEHHFRGFKQMTLGDAIDRARTLLETLEGEYAMLKKEGHYKGREVEDSRRMTWQIASPQTTR